jgi:hypothetical protein
MTTATVTSDLGYRPNFGDRKACFAHYHLKVEEYGLWAHARQLAHDSGIFYFDGRKIAERFGETGKNTIYRIGKNLVRKGWLVVVRKPKRLKNGMFSPAQYRPVSHEEWAARHPGACLEIQAAPDITSPGIRTGEDDTSPGNGNDLSWNQERPVLESGHNIKGLNKKGECKGNPESSTCSVQEPHTPITNSKAKAHRMAEKNEDEIEPDQTSIPDHQSQNQCVVAAPDEDAILARVWDYYLAATGKDPKLNTLTAVRRRLGKARLRECRKKTANPENAEKLMCCAIDALAKSDWHMGRDPKTHGQCYNEWESNLFKSYETMERHWNR